MLAFFRKIRHKYVEKSAIKKYLIYAVGEILLVMVGILLALQVNNWNEEHKRSKIETKLLIDLERDLQKSLNDMNLNILIHNKVDKSKNRLFQHLKSDLPYSDSLSNHFASAFLWTRFAIDKGAYEAINAHGLDILSNDELRDQLVQLFGANLLFLRNLETLVQDYAEQLRRQDFVQHFESTFIDFGPSKNGFSYGKSVPKDYDELRSNPDFLYHLSSFHALSQTLQKIGNKPYKKKIENLIQLIQSELEKS